MVRLILVIFLTFALSSQTHAAVKWNNSSNTSSSSPKTQLKIENPIPALSGLGINSMVMWSGLAPDELNPHLFKDNFLNHFSNLTEYGFKHMVLVSCADWIISLSCKQWWQDKEFIIEAAKLLLDNTNLHVVVQLKGYKSRIVDGRKRHTLYEALENDKVVQQKFISSWIDITTELKSYPKDRLSFSLLNEPEFEFPKVTKFRRDKWLKIARRTIEEIRRVSPNRVILLEGVGKSLFSRRFTKTGMYKYYNPNDILLPINLDNVIYAFHTYEPERFTQQGTVFGWGIPYSEKFSKVVAKDAKKAIAWANKHQVPIMITEIGCVGFLEDREGPETNSECGKLATDLKSNYLDAGVGISWWALEKEKTIFNRNCRNKWGSEANCWMPSGSLVPNEAIFSAFGLKSEIENFTYTEERQSVKKVNKPILSKLRKDAGFRECLLKNGFKDGQLNQARFHPFARESQLTIDRISKSNCL